MIALSMLYYDYGLTFGIEVERFWKKARLSPVSVLFALNRYLGLLGPVPVIAEYFVVLPSSVGWISQGLRCRALQRYHQYYAIVSQVIVGMILIARTYALYHQSRQILIGLITLAVALVVATFVASSVNTTAVTSMPALETLISSLGCDLSLTLSQGLRSAVGWIAMLCLDTTVFVLTLLKTARTRSNLQNGLLMVLFRDGAVYYGILVVAGVANLLTFVAPHIGDTNRGLATTLTNALSTTLISRISLNLRDPHLRGEGTRHDALSSSDIGRSTGTTRAGSVIAFVHPQTESHLSPLSTESESIPMSVSSYSSTRYARAAQPAVTLRMV